MRQVNGQKEAAINQQERARLELIDKVKNMDIDELIEFFKTRHPSENYIIIRDIITDRQKKMIKDDEKDNKIFKEISSNAKKSWDEDHRSAMMLDVNNVANQVYQHLNNAIMKLKNDVYELKSQLSKLLPQEESLEDLTKTILDPDQEEVQESQN